MMNDVKLKIVLRGKRIYLHSPDIVKSCFDELGLDLHEDAPIDFLIRKQMTETPYISHQDPHHEASVTISCGAGVDTHRWYLFPSGDALESEPDADVVSSFDLTPDGYSLAVGDDDISKILSDLIIVGKKWYSVFDGYNDALMVRRVAFFGKISIGTELSAIKRRIFGNADFWECFMKNHSTPIIVLTACRLG